MFFEGYQSQPVTIEPQSPLEKSYEFHIATNGDPVEGTPPVSNYADTSTLGPVAVQEGLGASGGQNQTVPPETGEQNSTRPNEISLSPPPSGWTPKQKPDKDGLYPIAHPLEFYQRAKELRLWGQDHMENHKDSDTRHATVSYLLTKEYGPNWTRLAGLANEVQGFFWHDIFDLPARYSGERPWAFSLDDFKANEIGIHKAEQEIEAQKQP